MAKDYLLHLKLNGFLNSRLIESKNEVTGKTEKGIFIPLDDNDIKPNNRGNYYAKCWLREWTYETGFENQSHVVNLKLPKGKIKFLKEHGWDNILMGYVTRWAYSNNDNSKPKERVKLSDYE